MRFPLRILLFILFLCVSVFAQSQTVSGIITDEKDGSRVTGATIKVKGSKATAVSQNDGSFSIPANRNNKLLISYVGYASKEVSVSGPTLNVTLSQISQSLSEVVVVGYGT